MGTVLRLLGLTINNPSAPVALTEPFGVSGLSHRYEADSFSQIASGSPVTPPIPDKVTGGGTTVASGTTTKGPALSAYASTDKFDSLTWAPASGDVGVDNWTDQANTVAVVFGYTGNPQSAKVFDLMGRKFVIGASAWIIQPTDESSASTTYPLSSQPKPDYLQLGVAVVQLPADAASPCGVTLRTGGSTSKFTGVVARTAASSFARLRIGAGSTGGSGNSVVLAAMAIWPRVLTDTEITGTLIPALRTRYGVQ